MIIWVLYDIVTDAARNSVAKACLKSGLYRVQYSCFLGSLSANQKDVLELQIEEAICEDTDKVYLFQMDRTQLKECRMMGQAFDSKLITDEIKSMFF